MGNGLKGLPVIWFAMVGLIFISMLTNCTPIIPLLNTALPEATLTPSPNPTVFPTISSTPSPTNTPYPTDTLSPQATSTLVSTLIPEVKIGYDFETGTQGWTTSEGKFKLAEITESTMAHSGKQSIELKTILVGNGNQDFKKKYNSDDVYRHTEAVGYFSHPPAGFNDPGPYNLTGKNVSCYVYLPTGLATEQNSAYIRLFVKDKKFANEFSDGMDIIYEKTNNWIKLSLLINTISGTDFDPTQTNAIGLRIDTHDGFPLNFTGSIFIDDCTIE